MVSTRPIPVCWGSTPFPAKDIWKAFAEPKCVFFAWLVLHNKAHTVDNLLKKNQQGATECSLCLSQQETTTHLLTHCIFFFENPIVIFQKPFGT
jgi:hypothetical protein